MVQRTLNHHYKSQILLKEMSEFVQGKNIMITGATSGIGLELAKSFSSKGANIIMLGKDENKLDELYDETSVYSGKNLIIRSDLRQLDENCLLYTSPSPRDSCASRMPSSA